MASKQPGPVGEVTRTNLRRIREEQGISLRDLAKRLAAVGYPILASGLGRIELGERRVDVDDLFALALALRISPLQLLLPGERRVDSRLSLTPNTNATTRGAWMWAAGEGHGGGENDLPEWAFEHVRIPCDELVEATQGLVEFLDVLSRVPATLNGGEAAAMAEALLEKRMAKVEQCLDEEQRFQAVREQKGAPPGVTDDPLGREQVQDQVGQARAAMDRAERALGGLRAIAELKRRHGEDRAVEMLRGLMDGSNG